jgi:hypothetical protein
MSCAQVDENVDDGGEVAAGGRTLGGTTGGDEGMGVKKADGGKGDDDE